MGDKLSRAQGRARYAMRIRISEGLDGWVKEMKGFRRFDLHRLDKERGEWHLACLALCLERLGRLAAC